MNILYILEGEKDQLENLYQFINSIMEVIYFDLCNSQILMYSQGNKLHIIQ